MIKYSDRRKQRRQENIQQVHKTKYKFVSGEKGEKREQRDGKTIYQINKKDDKAKDESLFKKCEKSEQDNKTTRKDK